MPSAMSSRSDKDIKGDLDPLPPRDWDDQEERRLLIKIDMRCMPALIILFILNFIRGNLANARLKGLQEDLHLNDTQFASSLSILFAGYILMQVPSNLVMNTISKPRYFMSVVVILWGAVSALTALNRNFSHLLACRFFLGFIEAPFFPSAVYYLSRWYTRKEIGLRIAVLNAGNMLAQGLGGLLAAGILTNMEGVRGIRGWRWLFIIEGAITIAFGFMVPLILADYPASTSWLSDRERYIAQSRLVRDIGLIDNPDASEKTGSGILQGVVLAITDIKVLAMALMIFTYFIGVSFSQYLPTIAKTLGFDTTITLLLTFPPWAFATLFTLVNSWHSDRTGDKFWHIALAYGFAILGYIIALTSTTVAGRYISLFGMCMGYSGGIITLGWISSSIPRPPVKRAAAIAFINGFGNIGQIPASYLWPSKWGPSYWRSFTTAICLLCVTLSVSLAYRQYLIHLNRKLEAGETEAYAVSETAAQKTAELVNVSISQEKEFVHTFRYQY